MAAKSKNLFQYNCSFNHNRVAYDGISIERENEISNHYWRENMREASEAAGGVRRC